MQWIDLPPEAASGLLQACRWVVAGSDSVLVHHVLTGYDTTPMGEICVAACVGSATDADPIKEPLDEHLFWSALERGAAATPNFGSPQWDWQGQLDRELSELRAQYGLSEETTIVIGVDEKWVGAAGPTLLVESAGTYRLDLRVASDDMGDGSIMHFEIDGVDITGPIWVAPTGGWQAWTTISVSGVQLPAGENTLRLVIDDGNFNLNLFDFVKEDDSGGG